MALRTVTQPPNDGKMWRKLLAAAHPDRGGDHELFIWAKNLQEEVREGNGHAAPPPPPPPPKTAQQPKGDSIPFDDAYSFSELTRRALRLASELPEPYASLLALLEDIEEAFSGPLHKQQGRGATYKQLAAAGHAAGLSGAQRARWYDIARSIPLSRRHAGHILSELKKAAA